MITPKTCRLFFTTVFIATLSYTLTGCVESSPAPSHIYFSVKTIGPSVNIYSLNDEGIVTKHTDDTRWRDLDMDVSPEGDLVFLSNRKDDFKVDLNKHTERLNVFLIENAATNSDVMATTADNSAPPKPQQISHHPETETTPQFHPNGEGVSYLVANGQQMQLMLLPTGKTEPKVLMTSDKILTYDWSSDGNTLVIGHTQGEISHLSLLHLNSAKIQNLVSLPLNAPSTVYTPNDSDPFMKQVAYVSLSPNGEHIAYIRNPNYRGSRQLRLYSLKTGNDLLLSPVGAHSQDFVSWSPDENTLLFSALVDYKFYYNEETFKKVYEGGMHIFQHTMHGQTQQLTAGDHVFKHPTYSPTGDRIAFFYSEKLGERQHSLRTMTVAGEHLQVLHEKISPSSTLIWQ